MSILGADFRKESQKHPRFWRMTGLEAQASAFKHKQNKKTAFFSNHPT